MRLFLLLIALSLTPARVKPATCGTGSVGDGACAQTVQGTFLCCSEWGWCGSSDEHCATRNNSSPTQAPTPAPTPQTNPTTRVSSGDDSRLIAYLGNWQSCPTAAQLVQYTHVVIAFAVSYTWSPSKNICSPTCDISLPTVCENQPNPALISDLHASGKKVLLSFGGAGMGGSWAGDVNDCWDYCFGRETQVVDRLTEIVEDLDLDGVDIDYEYFYQNNQGGSNFALGAQAITFLEDVTLGLRAQLPPGSIVAHAPMDSDMVPGSGYFELLRTISSSLDFLMPQYYNGPIRPALDGIYGTGAGSLAALPHYDSLVNDLFLGDAAKIVFGFCINDCAATNSNANGNQAASVMTELSVKHQCNGGAFFWVAQDDVNAAWSSVVSPVVQSNAGCSSGGIIQTAPPLSTPAPISAAPFTPVSLPTTFPTASPTIRPSLRGTTNEPTPAISNEFCCSYNYQTCAAPEDWCNKSQSICAGCGGNWQRPADNCIAKWGECTNDVNGCCAPSTCQGNQWYKQCL